ncbi:MAG: GNAT family N-acetyltransferase [candidate division KSB1 bacterium]|nr:GNAT family N-acetyltransferase [candidate division KSB1 bacterium]MDZ7336364.1 GNAT family N-acetyltransferase [candidate division KSB1 bacterium]MDZ7356656.1 GNAT family N-acetyltransferase [candidate division KSB1 bacterium]MDZ7375988.1 GNAT family N-acetyltransferase [candidate division KSB1 bacterium]MDZ7398533.1 GNAT family N-acetyltransferase [candidate division KSB1 bacterium]
MDRPFLIGKKIYLRPVEPEDAAFLARGENHPAVREALFLAFPVSMGTELEKIEQFIKSKEAIVLIIVDQQTNQPVGQTAFFRIDFVSRAAVFYLAILDPSHWSKGYGSEATQLMVDYAFETLNLNRIQLHVCAENTPAIRIYERAGFKKEGVLRQAMFRNGAYVDFWVMGILRSDWSVRSQNSQVFSA